MRGGVILTLHIVCTMMASSDEAEYTHYSSPLNNSLLDSALCVIIKLHI